MKKYLMAMLLAFTLTGCRNMTTNDLGQDVQNGIEDTGEGIRDGLDNIEDGIENGYNNITENKDNESTSPTAYTHFDLWTVPSYCNAMMGTPEFKAHL